MPVIEDAVQQVQNAQSIVDSFARRLDPRIDHLGKLCG